MKLSQRLWSKTTENRSWKWSITGTVAPFNESGHVRVSSICWLFLPLKASPKSSFLTMHQITNWNP